LARRKQRIFGASRLRRKLAAMPGEINKDLKEVIQYHSRVYLSALQAATPYSTDLPLVSRGRARGHLRDAFEIKTARNGLAARIGLFGKRNRSLFYYLLFLEFGTKKTARQAFVFPTWRSRRPAAQRAVKRATIVALRRVAGRKYSDG